MKTKKIKAWAVMYRIGIVDIATPNKQDAEFFAKQINRKKIYPCEITYKF